VRFFGNRRVALLLLGGLLLVGARGVAWAGEGLAREPRPLAVPADPSGKTNPLPLAPEPLPDPVGSELLRAWSLPARGLDERAESLQQAALGLGLRHMEGAARALLLDGSLGSPLERARAAARLAPELPAARFALAHALWSEGGSPLGVLGELRAGLTAVPRHLEARVWVRATVLQAAAWALAAGGLLFLAVAGAAALRRAVGDLAGLPGSPPAASRFALLAGLLLVPAALGEGVLGLALAAAGLAFAYGPWGQRAAVAAAVALVLWGLFPLAERAAHSRAAIAADPVAQAALVVERSLPSAGELARVRFAAPEDPLAARALALRAKREGDLEAADAGFALLLEGADATLLNNAANVRLALGRTEEAIALYEEAAHQRHSAEILFNLAQAYGRAIRLDAQDRALRQAQQVDARQVADLAVLFAAAPGALGAVDLPPPVELVEARLLDEAAASALAAAWRRQTAPGWLGTGARQAGLGAAGALLVGQLLGALLSRLPGSRDEAFYRGMARLLQSAGGSPARRMQRLAALRAQQARIERAEIVLSCVVPGAAGALGRRPWLGLVGAMLFAAALSAAWHRAGVVHDPLALGLGVGLALWAAGALALLYAGVTGLALSLRERP
jgi:tetratricopeptide (TPR) repeat protein